MLAGGQSLIPLLALRMAGFDQLVNVARIDALQGSRSATTSIGISTYIEPTRRGGGTRRHRGRDRPHRAQRQGQRAAEVARVAYAAPRDLPEGMEPGLENTSRYTAPPTRYANSTQICTCEVDVATGKSPSSTGWSGRTAA